MYPRIASLGSPRHSHPDRASSREPPRSSHSRAHYLPQLCEDSRLAQASERRVSANPHTESYTGSPIWWRNPTFCSTKLESKHSFRQLGERAYWKCGLSQGKQCEARLARWEVLVKPAITTRRTRTDPSVKFPLWLNQNLQHLYFFIPRLFALFLLASTQITSGYEPSIFSLSSSHPQVFSAPPLRSFFQGLTEIEISSVILPQVHLRKPCYDFYFL